jgi:hypothetical protein
MRWLATVFEDFGDEQGGAGKRPTANSSRIIGATGYTAGVQLLASLHSGILQSRASEWKALQQNRETRAQEDQKFQFVQTVALAGIRIEASKEIIGG